MTILRESEDRFHNLDIPGSYEWTYFDGLSYDGEWGFAAIWFRGCPMSPYYTAAIDRSRNGDVGPDPADYSAFNINLYHRGRRIFYLLHEGPASRIDAEMNGYDARVGGNAARSGGVGTPRRTYILSLDSRLALGRGRLAGEIMITSEAHELGAIAADFDPASRGHFWVPATLGGSFYSELDLWRPGRGARRLRFEGRTYHDRNFGTSPLHHIRGDWHWGRLHSERDLFVYFSVAHDDPARTPFQQILLLRDGELLPYADRFELLASSRRGHWASLPYPRLIAGSTPDGAIRFTVSEERRLDSGPFYHRLLSHIRVEGDRVMEGYGITEFLRPDRLGVAAFRPFVKFRVRRR